MDIASLFTFPNPANEKTARVVAGFVALVAVVGLATGWMWLLAVMAAGFWLRVAAGPRLSPVAVLANRVIAPRLGPPKMVPGPPKRFAQAIGAVTTTAGALLALGLGVEAAGYAVFAIMAVFATLESVFAVCVGCRIFALLMRAGIIPREVCEACADVTLRRV